jgi:outer membrane protein OmpA-like peptidoglycan-associated protein
MLRVARERKPTEIAVYGHADASGSEERNTKLSAERARVVADLLRKSDPSLDNIQVQFFGDREPLVPSEGRAPEPRNRRAEVVIL